MTSNRKPRLLELEVRWDENPIRGRIHEPELSLEHPFSGWLGLMAALQAASKTERATPSEEGRA